jgi:SAM-dependent methyltransferase
MNARTLRPRVHDWASFVGAVAALAAVTALVAGDVVVALAFGLVAVGNLVGARRSSRRDPRPMPHALRWVLYLPRWPLTVARLRRILRPRPGERLLEIGPGVGIYTVPVAGTLGEGTLDAVDVQPQMLADLARRTRAAGVHNVVAAEGDAQRLPYLDAVFDGAYLVGVLGEIPDPGAALRELRRVLKPGGRLVIGEVLVLDPDGLGLALLREIAGAAGFVLEERLGPRVAYFARFRGAP